MQGGRFQGEVALNAALGPCDLAAAERLAESAPPVSSETAARLIALLGERPAASAEDPSVSRRRPPLGNSLYSGRTPCYREGRTTGLVRTVQGSFVCTSGLRLTWFAIAEEAVRGGESLPGLGSSGCALLRCTGAEDEPGLADPNLVALGQFHALYRLPVDEGAVE